MNMNAWKVLNTEYAKFNLELRKSLSDESYSLVHIPTGDTALDFNWVDSWVITGKIDNCCSDLLVLVNRTRRELSVKSIGWDLV